MQTDNTNIEGKVVVITGASSGLGEATARYLAERGATVVLGARRIDRLQALVDEITRVGGRAFALATDVTDAAQVQGLVDAAVERALRDPRRLLRTRGRIRDQSARGRRHQRDLVPAHAPGAVT